MDIVEVTEKEFLDIMNRESIILQRQGFGINSCYKSAVKHLKSYPNAFVQSVVTLTRYKLKKQIWI